MRHAIHTFGVVLGGLVVLAGGCAGTGERNTGSTPLAGGGNPAAELGAPGVPASFLGVAAFDGRTGERLAWDALVERCAGAQVVMIGEEHDLEPAQMMAADLFAAILERRPTAALSLEFFEKDEQIHLDDYLAGLTTEEQFRSATGRREGNYPAGHRAMVEAAKAAGAPVIASNAPRRYVRLARLDGYERLGDLSPDQRATFVVPRAMPAGRYREEFIGMMSAMGAHGEQVGPTPPEDQRRAVAR